MAEFATQKPAERQRKTWAANRRAESGPVTGRVHVFVEQINIISTLLGEKVYVCGELLSSPSERLNGRLTAFFSASELELQIIIAVDRRRRRPFSVPLLGPLANGLRHWLRYFLTLS